MKTNKFIVLKHLLIENKKFIGLKFNSDKVLNSLIKELDGIIWSPEFNLYCLPNSKINLDAIFNLFRGVAWINTNYFFERSNSKKLDEDFDVKWFRKRQKPTGYKCCPESYLEKLELKHYANNTVKTYVSCFERFINFYNSKDLDQIDENDINSDAIKKSEIIFLEGYLWDEGEPKKAFDKAITYSNKVAMSLSDLFCVERHKKHFLELAKNKLDIIFANEQEITSLIDANSFEEIVTFSKQIKKNVVITRGEKGAISILNNELIECEAQKNLNIKDLTGAGDLFAAGYLHGIINNLSIKECLIKGTELSSKIIQKIGARI